MKIEKGVAFQKSAPAIVMHFAFFTEQRLCKNAAEISLKIMRTSISVAIYEQALGLSYLHVSLEYL